MGAVTDRLKPLAKAGALTLALLLAGCGIFGKKADLRECPRISILNDASLITLYRDGAGRDLTDVAFEVRIAKLTSKCAYRGESLRSEAKIEIIAGRGPGAQSRETTVRFFVSIIDMHGNIRAKEIFDSKIEFPEGKRRAGVFEEIEQFIDLRDNETGASYEVIVGFQLTKEQLERNRKRRL